jgi:cyanate permease
MDVEPDVPSSRLTITAALAMMVDRRRHLNRRSRRVSCLRQVVIMIGCLPGVIRALIWALYNIGFVMIFSFGPSMLVERGWSITAAGSAISIVLWLSAVSVPTGGLLADRTDRHDAIMASCFSCS